MILYNVVSIFLNFVIFYNLHMIEEKGYYSLDKTFSRIIEQYLVFYSDKNSLLNKLRSTLKFGIHFQNGAEPN